MKNIDLVFEKLAEYSKKTADDEGLRKNIIEILESFNAKERKEFVSVLTDKDLEIVKLVIADTHPISRYFTGAAIGESSSVMQFYKVTKYHFPQEQRLKFYRKFATPTLAADFILSSNFAIDFQAFQNTSRLKDESAKARINEKTDEIKNLLQEYLNAAKVLDPAIAFFIPDYLVGGIYADLILNEFIKVLTDTNDSEKLEKAVVCWTKIMPDISKRKIRQIYHDSEKQSKAKENAKRALILLGESHLLSAIETIEGDVFMGDVYNNSGQVGAFGANSTAHDFVMNQYNGENIDFAKLTQELSILQKAMKEKASSDEHDIAVGNVTLAKQAAQEKNGKTVAEKLKAAGKWAFEIATTIGTTVAAEAIKVSLGLK